MWGEDSYTEEWAILEAMGELWWGPLGQDSWLQAAPVGWGEEEPASLRPPLLY